MESNRTAVQWLKEKWYSDERITDETFEQAKEMFEKQIIDAWLDGVSNWDATDDYDAKQYFEKTFNK
jgi:hypothetical protein